MSAVGLFACGNSPKPSEKNIASKPVAASAAPTEELWRYAPGDTLFGVVAADGVLADLYAQGSIMLDDASAVPAIELGTTSIRQSIRGLLATIGLPDNIEFAEMGLDLRLGAAFFTGDIGDVLVLPVSDRKRFVLAMRGTVGAETDSLGAGRVCKMLGSHYVCGSSAAQLAALAQGAGLSEEVASWPASHRGQLEAFVSPSRFKGKPFSEVMSKIGGVRVAAKVGKGEVEVRAHLVGTPTGVLAEIVGASPKLFDGLRTIPSSGALILGFSRIWSKYRADLRGSVGTPSVKLDPVAKRLADENWNFAGWGFGTMDAILEQMASAIEMESNSIPADAVPAVWAAAHLNEFGFGVRVADDGAHAWFKLRTAWSNSDAVMSKLRPALRGLAENDPTGVQSLATIREKYPESRWAQDTRDGGGGILIAATVGILAAVAIPAYMKYMERVKTSEALYTLKRLHMSASVLATEGKLPPSAPRTPPISADCTHEGKREKFAVNAAYWEHPTWKALGFSERGEHYYAYEFVNHGDWYQIVAYGDLDCDGDYSKYTIGHSGIPGQLDSEVVVENGLE